MAGMMIGSIGINWISIIMLAILLVVYIMNYKKYKSGFTIGLVIFAGLLLLQNVLQVYFYTTSMQAYPPIVEQSTFIFEVIEIIAYGVILWVTLRH